MATFSARFDASDRLPSVPVRVNGEGPFDFGLDNGAPGAIGAELAGVLGLPATGPGRVRIGSYDAGPVRVATDLDEAVKDLSRLWLGPGRPAYGVLGYRVLAGLVTTVDHPRGTVTLSTEATPRPSPGPPEIRMRLHPDPTVARLPILAVRVDDWISARMFLHLGAPQSTVSEELCARLSDPDAADDRVHTGPEGPRAVLDSIVLGHPRTRRVRNAVCRVAPRAAWIHDAGYAQLPIDGIVGRDLLGGFRVTLAYRERRILLA